MITETKYIKYDYVRHEYYLTYAGVIEHTQYDDAEIKEMFVKPDQALKDMSRRVYQYIYSKNTAQNRKHIHFRIYNDISGERIAIQDAILEYFKGAMESGKDLNPYQDDEGNDMPSTAVDILRNAGLFNRGILKTETEYGDY